jgi:hypothetical protein
VNDAEDAVGANELSREDGSAAFAWVTGQALGIDGGEAAILNRVSALFALLAYKNWMNKLISRTERTLETEFFES